VVAGEGVAIAEFTGATDAVGAGDDEKAIVIAEDEVAAIFLEMGPGFFVYVRGLGDDVGHDESRIAHFESGGAIAVGAHVATIETAVGVVVGGDAIEERGKIEIGCEVVFARGGAEIVFGDSPTDPVGGAFGAVVGEGVVAIDFEEIVFVGRIGGGGTGIAQEHVDGAEGGAGGGERVGELGGGLREGRLARDDERGGEADRDQEKRE